MNIEKQTAPDRKLLDDLKILLERQINFAHQGNLSGVELLSIQTESLIEEIERLRIPESEEFKKEYDDLSKLYQELYLTLTLDKEETLRELGSVRKAKKTVQAYHSNI